MGDDRGEVGPARRWLRDGPGRALIRVLRFDEDREAKRVHCPEREPELGAGFPFFELGDPEPACADTLAEVGLTETGGDASSANECPDRG